MDIVIYLIVTKFNIIHFVESKDCTIFVLRNVERT